MSQLPFNVLLVEDEKADVDLFVDAVNSVDLSASINVLSDGESAIEYLSAIVDRYQLPHMIILDLNLPKKMVLKY